MPRGTPIHQSSNSEAQTITLKDRFFGFIYDDSEIMQMHASLNLADFKKLHLIFAAVSEFGYT